MSFNRPQLTDIKRQLIAARIHVQEARARSRRAGDTDFAERLRNIVNRIAAELDYVDVLLSRLP
jgi:hypothetical protein